MNRLFPGAILALAALVGSTALSGCPPQQEEAPAAAQTPSASPEAVAAAKKKFETLCATCHGKTGLGDGPGAAALDPKPRNYTDAAWQDSVTDEFLAKIILEGGSKVGKSPVMPPSPDLKDKPEVVDELVKLIRSFKK